MSGRSPLPAAPAVVAPLLERWERLDRGWKASVLGAGIVLACLLI